MWMQERESAGRQLERFSVRPARDDGFGPCPSRRGGRTAPRPHLHPLIPGWGVLPQNTGRALAETRPFTLFLQTDGGARLRDAPRLSEPPPSWAARGLASPGAKQ